MPQPAPVVAVFNSSEDTTDMLRVVLEHAGFVVISAMTNELRDGKDDFAALMREHKPHAIVYDVAIPYEENWRLFEHFRGTPACQGVHFVITTTNAAQLKKIAGEQTTMYEIVGKPYDLQQIVRAVEDGIAPAPEHRTTH